MNKHSLSIFTLLVLATLVFLTASCTNSLFSSSDTDGDRRLPHVAVAPIKISCSSPTPWDLSDEVGFFLEKQLSKSGELRISSSSFLRAHQRVPAPSLWHGNDLGPSRMLLPHDFIVLMDIVHYEYSQDHSQGIARAVNSAKQTKPFLYEIQAFVRVIDLTGPTPKLAMQEIFRIKVPISLGQVQTDQLLTTWTSRQYFGGAYAAVTAKTTSVIGKRIEERIIQAWQRRVPISRYPRSLHSKL